MQGPRLARLTFCSVVLTPQTITLSRVRYLLPWGRTMDNVSGRLGCLPGMLFDRSQVSCSSASDKGCGHQIVGGVLPDCPASVACTVTEKQRRYDTCEDHRILESRTKL